MARCPICKTECYQSDKCTSCGFDDIRSEFLNQEDYNFWQENIVKPYKAHKCYNYSDFKINGKSFHFARLDAYVGNSAEVVVPNGITRIGKNAFANNKTITKLILPSEVWQIDDSAFENCDNLVEIILPSKLKKIGNKAFCNCKSLKELKLGTMLEGIGEDAFANCISLSEIVFSQTQFQTLIGDGAFRGCISLSETNFLANTSHIGLGNYVFSNCKSLRKIVIPKNVSLKTAVFENCNITVFFEINPSGKIWAGNATTRVFGSGTWHFENGHAVPNEKAYEYLV